MRNNQQCLYPPKVLGGPYLGIRLYYLWEELLVVLVGGRLYALAHGVRQKVAHLGVAAGAAVWGVDVEGILLDAGGQWCGKAASLDS